MQHKVFISYAHEDERRANWLRGSLTLGGSDVFIDKHRLRFGTNWPEELIRETHEANRFILIWSRHSRDSDWVQKEYEEALQVRASRGDNEFLQIEKIDSTPLPPALKAIQFLDRAGEELLILASGKQKRNFTLKGLMGLVESPVTIEIARISPRATRLITHEAAELADSPLPGRIKWSGGRAPDLPMSLRLSAFRLKDQGERESRPLVLIPNIMASKLTMNGKRVWLNMFALLMGGLEKLRIERSGVEAESLLEQLYSSFINQAKLSSPVMEFPYDWRRSFADSAYSLTTLIRYMFDHDPDCAPIFVADGTGSFVVRGLAAFYPDLWKECEDRGVKVIFVGAPENGSYYAAEMLTATSGLLRKLGFLDIRHSVEELARIMAAFPAFCELLPEGPEQDLLDPSFWEGSGFAVEPAAVAAAKEVRAGMKESLSGEEIHYIYGHAEETITHLSLEGGIVRKRITLEGDGTAPYALTFPESRPPKLWFTEGPSSVLLSQPHVIRAVGDLAIHGDTTVLSRTLPSTR